MWPPSSAFITSALPLNGTCTRLPPAMDLNISAAPDDHSLPRAVHEALSDQAADVVAGTARHKRDNELDLLGGIDLGCNRRGRCKDDCQKESAGRNWKMAPHVRAPWCHDCE